MSKRRVTLAAVFLFCLSGFCGCGRSGSPGPTTLPETVETTGQTAEKTSSVEETEAIGFNLLAERTRQTVQTISGLEVLSGTVIKMSRRSMQFTPASGDGTFAVNGKLSADSEIAFCINPAGILNYRVTVQSDAAREVKAEIRVFKGGKLLASNVQPGLLLDAGENEIDACVDTREGEMCFGVYVIRFYIDDCCVSETSEYL